MSVYVLLHTIRTPKLIVIIELGMPAGSQGFKSVFATVAALTNLAELPAAGDVFEYRDVRSFGFGSNVSTYVTALRC